MAKKVYLFHPYWDARLITSAEFEEMGLKNEPDLHIKPNGVGVEVSDEVYDYLMNNEPWFQDHAPTKEERETQYEVTSGFDADGKEMPVEIKASKKAKT